MSAFNQFSDRLKREAAELLWRLPRQKPGDATTRALNEQITRDGYCVMERFVDPATVDQLAQEAERAYEEHVKYVSLESNGSDKRIYGVDRVCPAFALNSEMKTIDELSRAFYWSNEVPWFQMLGKISASAQNLGSGSGWHRDSPFSHQFKAILYLSDVSEDNGPFEFIPGTHRRDSLAAVTNFLQVAGSLYRFTSEHIERLEEARVVARRQTFTGPKGTLLLIDSRGLHRGKPLRIGTRLAVTRYYFPRKIPAEFIKQYPLTAENPVPRE